MMKMLMVVVVVMMMMPLLSLYAGAAGAAGGVVCCLSFVVAALTHSLASRSSRTPLSRSSSSGFRCGVRCRLQGAFCRTSSVHPHSEP